MSEAAADAERRAAWRLIAPSLAIGLAVLWAAAASRPDFERLAVTGANMLRILKLMAPPSAEVLGEALEGALETLRIALLGTAGCVIFSAVLGPLTARRLVPGLVHVPLRGLLALVRGVPVILGAAIMVAAAGPGAMAGILAIWVHGTGMLARFYADAIDAVDPAPAAVLRGSGAGFLQSLRFGLWPQMGPEIVRDTLYRFELNLREALVLGLVGAGGVGARIEGYVRGGAFDRAATFTLIVVAFVLAIELANSVYRRLVR